jgi:sulfur-carrier protein
MQAWPAPLLTCEPVLLDKFERLQIGDRVGSREAMMRVVLPTPLDSYTGGQREIEASGESIAELLNELDRRYPGLRFRVIDEQDRIRPHIRFFVNGTAATDIVQPLSGSDEVLIVAALSGG